MAMRDERRAAVAAHARREGEQPARRPRSTAGVTAIFDDVRARVRHLLVQAVEVVGHALEVVVGDDEPARPTFSTITSRNPLR